MPPVVNAIDLIQKTRDQATLSRREIQALVQGAVDGSIPDYQLSAWLMAAFLRGLTARETLYLTEAFISSGEILDFSSISAPKVDKHSTGGVGDKTSLAVAPLAAAAGLSVPMISGRGLGHTGGTLDKLEAIPGFQTQLSAARFRRCVEKHGLAIVGAGPELAPADKVFYALRDVTATVESIPLIVASILSKKAAEGIDGLVLDVKTGRGAFMRTLKDSTRLAEKLVQVGVHLGKKVTALVSDMSQPLGRKVGNSLEVEEAIETLRGEGPSDFTRLSIELASRMLKTGGLAKSIGEARLRIGEELGSGRGLQRFAAMVEAQGGDPRILDGKPWLRSRRVFEYTAGVAGYVNRLDADEVGRGALLLGAGRRRAGDAVNFAVGVVLRKKIGDRVNRGEALCEIHYDDETLLEEALPRIQAAYRLAPRPPRVPRLIRKVIG